MSEDVRMPLILAIVAVLAALWVFQIVGVLVAWRKHGR